MTEKNAIDILKSLVGFDTTSYKSNLDLIAFVESYLNTHNIKSTLVYDSSGKKANLYATIGSGNKEGIMLSGHTHAGQFFPLQAIVKMMFKYPWGTYNINNMILHTSSGSGTFTWPLRLGSVNEIALIRLLPKK